MEYQNSERQKVKAVSEVYRKGRTFEDPNAEMVMLLSGNAAEFCNAD